MCLEVLNYEEKFTVDDFQAKRHQEIEHNKEATEKVFRSLKARRKIRMMHFKVKMTGASYVIICKAHEFTNIIMDQHGSPY